MKAQCGNGEFSLSIRNLLGHELIKRTLYLHLFLESTLSRVYLFLVTEFCEKGFIFPLALGWLCFDLAMAFTIVGVLNLPRESFDK